MTPQRFNILLIDDNPADARLLEAAMREVAPRVTIYWVATGQEGTDALERRDRFQDIQGFDIVVMDLNMAPIDGFEILKGIRELPELIIPVIVMSSSRNPNDIERAYRCGANSYIVKSVTLEGAYEAAACIARYWLEVVALPSRQ